ncbi:Uncharacterised protein [uncultured archaeon]|nr:Uncharacterised protein [uncultured archaeon]
MIVMSEDLLDELQKTDRESARKLNELLSIIARNKGIYSGSKDPAIAQLWLAVLEIYSRQEKIQKQITGLSKSAPAPTEENASRLSALLRKKKDNSDILETLENY